MSNTSQNILCNANAILTALFETIQLISFAAVSFERLRMVKFPMLTVNIRIKLTKKLIVATWCLASFLSFFLFMSVSIISNYKNLNYAINECYLDFYHIFLFRPTKMSTVNVTSKISLNQNQNIIFDTYNFIITIFSLAVSISFYTSISLFLKQHKIEMEHKFHLSDHHKAQLQHSVSIDHHKSTINQGVKVFDFNGNVHIQEKKEDTNVQG